MKTQLETVDQFFQPEGLLADELTTYEKRPGQKKMATAVTHALNNEAGSRLVVEAETGIGKTIAYLVPAILSGQRVVISTNTLNLQDQIINREIPFLTRVLDPTLTVLCVKGRRNYLCLYRWHQLATDRSASLFTEENDLEKIHQWLKKTKTGDRAELAELPDNSPLWREINADASQCLGAHCPDEPTCFITRLRRQAAASRLLIVNHHLFFSDLALRHGGFGEVLPRYESVIFDEAHHLEDVATTHFGFSFSQYQLIDLAKDIERFADAELTTKNRDQVSLAARATIDQADHFATIFPQERGRFPLQDLLDHRPDWDQHLTTLGDRLTRLAQRLQSLDGETWRGLEQRAWELLNKLEAFQTEAVDQPGTSPAIRWFERRPKSVALISSPIEIASLLQESLYGQTKCCVFTSATLTVGGRFTYFIERLGLDQETETLSLPSPFDYRQRTLLYIPAHNQKTQFPEPASPNYLNTVAQTILRIISSSKGRALVLFTSFNAMRHVHGYLVEHLPFPVLLQGEAPKNILLENFQQQTDSVLLAVASFWEGIDVPGESLSCVIIDKLPFEVPSDPVIMARINKIKQDGGTPFFDLQVPRAILALRQGVGRLLRASTDHGLLAILDVRLFTKGYGRLFRASLPPSPISRDLDDLDRFFAKPPNQASGS